MEIPNHVKDGRNFNFTIFNNEIFDDYKLSGNEFFVYCYLLRRSQAKGSCFPSYDLACKDLQLSRATFSECIKKLNTIGLITIMHTKTLKGVMNIYLINEISKGSSKNELSDGGVVQKLNLGVVQNLDCNNINLSNNINLLNNTSSKLDFELFWNAYDKKTGSKNKLKKKWDKLALNIQKKILEVLPEYKNATPDKKFRKNPETYLNNESWDDEIVNQQPKQEKKVCVDYCGTDTRKIYYE